jgi:lipoate-protein ligase B
MMYHQLQQHLLVNVSDTREVGFKIHVTMNTASFYLIYECGLSGLQRLVLRTKNFGAESVSRRAVGKALHTHFVSEFFLLNNNSTCGKLFLFKSIRYDIK